MDTETAPSRRAGDGPERVYIALRREIIEQLLGSGERLAEPMLARRFEVSRTVVRAALERLVAEGLAERSPNHSARVATLDAAEAVDLLAVRSGIEDMVVDRLSGRLTEAQLQVLQAHVAREERVSSLRQPEAVRLAGEFHVLLAQATGSALLARYVADLVSRSSLVLAAHELPHSSSCAVREHLSLLELLRQGDAAGARAMMRAHLEHVSARAVPNLPGRLEARG